MAENALPYGSFGRAFYDPDEKEWFFQRNTQQHASLKQLPNFSFPRSERADARSRQEQHRERSSANVQKHVKGLSRTRPEIEPALNILPLLNQVSQAAQHVSYLQDPICGSLIAAGQVFVESSRRYASAIAHASGPTGNNLRIVSQASVRHHWNGRKDEWLVVPTPRGEEATWTGNGSPIQQIVFSPSTEGTESLLAVRYLTKVLIFRPIFSRNLSRQDGTLIDTNLLCELPPARYGQATYVHVTFNPWYSRQFATIDQAGTWSIWNLEGRKHVFVKETLQAKPLPIADTDGWARIAWLQSPSTILVCTRLEARLYDISFGLQYMQTVNLESSFGCGWILDVIVLTTHLDHVAFLTSTHLILQRAVQSLSGDVTMENICTLRHFLNADKPSFHIEACPVNEDSVLFVIKNDSSMLISYVFGDLGNPNIRLKGPATIMPSGADSAGCEMADCAGFLLQSVTMKKQQQDIDIALDTGLHNNAFLSATILHHNMVLTQVVCSVGAPNLDLHELQLSISDTRLQAKATRAPREQFIVGDDDVDTDEVLEGRVEPFPMFADHAEQPSQHLRITNRGVNYGSAARELVRNQFNQSSQDGNPFASTQLVLASQDRERSLPWRTLRDHDGLDMMNIDIETASQLLLDLKTTKSGVQALTASTEADDVTSLTIRNVQWPHDTHLSMVTGSLTETYDSVVSHWIASLPDTITGRIRLSKDRLARRMAADITLASHVVGYVPSAPSPPTQQTSDHHMQTLELPLRGSGTPYIQQTELDQASSTQLAQETTPPPLPTPRTTPSVITGSSSLPSTFCAPEITRLANYTSFSNTLPTSLPRSLARVLSHWQAGTNVEEYDWYSSRNRLAQQAEAEEADSQLTEKDRRRLQKQAEKLLRKQRKENKGLQELASIAASSQQWPEIAVSTSQQLPGQQAISSVFGGGFGSSQNVAGSGAFIAPASQIVRGRFGGRGPPVRKKRRQGF